ncbi:MAG: hypothetical protein EBX40_05665, partial [Gammaproteobacteria bacterium]|nr:hypothetical protein [Gammaproteobacteria bacterium]
LSKLYDHMEVKFHPLKLASGLEPMINAIKNDGMGLVIHDEMLNLRIFHIMRHAKSRADARPDIGISVGNRRKGEKSQNERAQE